MLLHCLWPGTVPAVAKAKKRSGPSGKNQQRGYLLRASSELEFSAWESAWRRAKAKDRALTFVAWCREGLNRHARKA